MKKKSSAALPENRPFLALVCALEAVYGVISMFAAVLLNNLATSVGASGRWGSCCGRACPSFSSPWPTAGAGRWPRA